MSQSNSTHRHYLKWSLITHHKDLDKLLRRRLFQHLVRLKCSVSKWSLILLSITECRHALMIIITALWLSFLQCYCIQWCADQYLLSRFTTRIVSRPNVSTFPIMFYAQNLSLTVLVTYLVSWVKLNCSPTELQCTSLQAAGWCSLGNTFSAFLHPYHASARKLIGWFLNFGSAHS